MMNKSTLSWSQKYNIIVLVTIIIIEGSTFFFLKEKFVYLSVKLNYHYQLNDCLLLFVWFYNFKTSYSNVILESIMRDNLT